MSSSNYPGTDDPLTGNTWVQGANEDDLVLATITYQSPSACNDPMAFLDVNLYLDGTPIGAFTLITQTPGATTTFPTAFTVTAPGADTPRALTAKVSSTCNEPFAVTAPKLDVAAVD